MGVKACFRYNCEKIMCDLYSSDFGYICYDCFDELLQKKWILNKKEITDFMNSEKEEDIDESAKRDYYKKYWSDE